MAISIPNALAPRSEPQKVEKEKKSDIEKIMEGLHLANGLLGIGLNVQKLMEEPTIKPPATRQIDTIGPDGKAITKIVEDKPGQEFASVPKEAAIRPPGTRAIQTMEGGKMVTKIVEDTPGQSFIAPPKAGGVGADGQKQLNAEQMKRLDSASMGLQAVADMNGALASGSNTFSLMGDNEFTLARRNFEEAIGRMQSGGAISSDEGARFREMAPTWSDSAEIQQKKLQNLQTEMALRVKNLGRDPEGLMQQRSEMAGRAPGGGGGGFESQAIAAPAGNVPALSDIDKELERRGVKPKNRGASGGF